MPTSVVTAGTFRMPRLVNRTAGAIAKMTVATTAPGTAIPNSTMTGSRYTYAGMTWAASSTARSRRSALSDSPAQIPRGTPIASDTTTEVTIRARVTIVSSQKPSTPQQASATAPVAAAFRPPVRHPISAASEMTPGHRSLCSSHSTPSFSASNRSPSGPKTLVNSQWVLLFRTVQA